MELTLQLNGQKRTFEAIAGPTLEWLVVKMGFQADRIAVELNGDIIPRTRWAETLLKDADRLELVQFVGGGAPVRSRSRRSQRSP